MRKTKVRNFQSETGAGMVEVALLFALVAMVAVPAVHFMGQETAIELCEGPASDLNTLGTHHSGGRTGNIYHFNSDSGACEIGGAQCSGKSGCVPPP